MMDLRKHLSWVLLAVAVVAVGVGGADQPAGPSYELVEVKRKVFREEPPPEIQLELDAELAAGDVLRTGSRSAAEVYSPEAAARFRIGAKARARLAPGTPGVLLEIEKGRVHALFDALVGPAARERLVTTPSAVLAVRGTEYGVEVDGKGNTTLTVFSGVVDVSDIGRVGDPIQVRAGQYSRIRRGKAAHPPERHDMSPGQWQRGGQPGGMDPGMGQGSSTSGDRDPGGMGAGSGGGSSQGSGGGGSRGGGGRG